MTLNQGKKRYYLVCPTDLSLVRSYLTSTQSTYKTRSVVLLVSMQMIQRFIVTANHRQSQSRCITCWQDLICFVNGHGVTTSLLTKRKRKSCSSLQLNCREFTTLMINNTLRLTLNTKGLKSSEQPATSFLASNSTSTWIGSNMSTRLRRLSTAS